MVTDATELDRKDRIDLLATKPRSRRGLVVAINEGPLKEAASHRSGDTYKKASEMLHRGRQSLDVALDANAPTVIDMAAFDPIEQGVVGDLLGLDMVNVVVDGSSCSCDPSDCPRRRAWNQLSSPEVRSRVAEVVKLAQLQQQDWLFREVWDLVADLALGGSCDEDPPTSTWFWRLFYGDTSLSHAIAQAVSPGTKALPGVDAHLYYADWAAEGLRLLDGVDFISLSKPDLRTARHQWLRLQVFLLGEQHDPAARVIGEHEGSFLQAAYRLDLTTLLAGINSYMTFGLQAPARTQLDLWTSHQVERRTDLTAGLVRLGNAPAADFAIGKSHVVLNHPNTGLGIEGSGRFLVHHKSSSSLDLTHDILSLLQTGRSRRISDRAHADLDWHLLRFFDSVLTTEAHESEIEVTLFNFDRLTAETRGYRVSDSPPLIEANQ